MLKNAVVLLLGWVEWYTKTLPFIILPYKNSDYKSSTKSIWNVAENLSANKIENGENVQNSKKQGLAITLFCEWPLYRWFILIIDTVSVNSDPFLY